MPFFGSLHSRQNISELISFWIKNRVKLLCEKYNLGQSTIDIWINSQYIVQFAPRVQFVSKVQFASRVQFVSKVQFASRLQFESKLQFASQLQCVSKLQFTARVQFESKLQFMYQNDQNENVTKISF